MLWSSTDTNVNAKWILDTVNSCHITGIEVPLYKKVSITQLYEDDCYFVHFIKLKNISSSQIKIWKYEEQKFPFSLKVWNKNIRINITKARGK